MPEELHQTDGRVEHPDVRNEPTDVRFRPILYILLGAMGFAALVHYAIWRFFEDYRGHEAAVKKSTFPLAPGPSNALPRDPRLEQVDRLAGNDVNAYELESPRLEALNSYGAAEESGFAHIPIDRAMTLMLENKLPAARDKLKAGPAPSEDQKRRSEGLLDAGGPNSGRMFRGETR